MVDSGRGATTCPPPDRKDNLRLPLQPRLCLENSLGTQSTWISLEAESVDWKGIQL